MCDNLSPYKRVGIRKFIVDIENKDSFRGFFKAHNPKQNHFVTYILTFLSKSKHTMLSWVRQFKLVTILLVTIV